ncbi:hypothetical protein Tsubulata_039400 [Turnera subulata]|uniref:Uncharacterized protein n=1 Tax=Turnera subulata TaxID=218843 RepID=A0A9Q0G6P1_9ROSI|nr:hypothetical protein Tsubulata_039400 [Turnera subulata]
MLAIRPCNPIWDRQVPPSSNDGPVNNRKKSGLALNETSLGLLYPAEDYKVIVIILGVQICMFDQHEDKFILVTTGLDVRDVDVWSMSCCLGLGNKRKSKVAATDRLVLGFGWAGLFRRYLVEPGEMWWPSILLQVSLFRALHEKEDRPKGMMTRTKFFLLAMTCGFAYYVVPDISSSC